MLLIKMLMKYTGPKTRGPQPAQHRGTIYIFSSDFLGVGRLEMGVAAGHVECNGWS